MAKYRVEHACGHIQTHELFGPVIDRQKKLAWFENTSCSECWKQEQAEKESLLPVVMTVEMNGIDTDENGDVIAYIVLSGGTRPRKEQIKSLGYFWGDVRGGLLDVTFSGRPRKAWQKAVRLVDLLDQNSDTMKQIEEDRIALEATIENKISSLDVAIAKKKLEEKRQKDELKQKIEEAVSRIPKPPKPECHPTRVPGYQEGQWNQKYYGSEKSGWYFFVNGKKYRLTNQQYEELMRFREQWKAYQDEVEKVKRAIQQDQVGLCKETVIS